SPKRQGTRLSGQPQGGSFVTAATSLRRLARALTRKRLKWVAGSALPPPLSPGCDVEAHGLGHERLDRGFVHAVSIEVVDCSDDFAVQPGIEEIAASHAGTPRERQPYGALEHVDEADVSVVCPKRNSLRFGGLLVLDRLDGSRV